MSDLIFKVRHQVRNVVGGAELKFWDLISDLTLRSEIRFEMWWDELS